MKVYYDETFYPSSQPQSRYSRYKAGNVGKSHSVARWPYTRRYAKGGTMGTYGSGYYYKDEWDRFALSDNERALMVNRCISKLEGKCGASGSVGSSIFAEGGESVRMAVKRLEDMADIARALRRKDFKRLKKIWNRPKKVTTAMSQAGGGWLEFSFGWAPLVQSISDGVAATGADFPKTKVQAVDRVSGTKNVWHGNAVTSSTYTQSIKIGYDVKVINPNTWLLGRLDLLNPLQWIYEAIPYSFLVDYFVNIGDMIHNLDSFAGLAFDNGYTTYYHRWDDLLRYPEWYPPDWSVSGSGEIIKRLGPTPLRRQLAIQQNPLTSSWRRGLNSASLLATKLR